MTAQSKPVRPRHAASLVLARRSGAKLEVLMGRRPVRSRFAPDVFVFPGGKLDRADWRSAAVRPLSTACVRRSAAPPAMAEALAAAALRETAEETGLILPADHSALTLMARAITPTESPIRFHARFFLADWNESLGGHADSAELADLAFRPLAEVAKLPLMDVTEAVLASLARIETGLLEPFLFTYRRGRAHVRALE